MSLFREPDAGNLPVRFDEREQETEPSQTGLRGRRESQVKHPPGDYSHCACSRLYSLIGDAAQIRARRVRKQKTDRQDAQLLLGLLLEDRFPSLWVTN